jgi:hypothetical protein
MSNNVGTRKKRNYTEYSQAIIWIEAIMDYFKLMSQYSTRGTEENNEK